MQFPLVFTGLGLMLIASFFDSLRGPLLPLISHELGLSYERVSLFLVVGYISAVIFGRSLIPLIEKWGVRRLAMTLCGLGPVAALAALGVGGLPSLLVLGVLVGCLSSAIGAVANLFVLDGTTPQKRGRFYSFLHTMYGLGSQAAPLILGIALAYSINWRWLYVAAAVPLAGMAGWIYWGLPKRIAAPPEAEQKPMPFRWFSIQGLLVACFALYVGSEVMTSMWMVAYLVEAHGMTVEHATPYATGFFVCMTLSRLACMLVQEDATERAVILVGLLAALGSLAAGFAGFIWALPLAGLVGPFFPLILARLTRYFPREAPTLTFRVLLGGQATVAACHFGVGWLATNIGATAAYAVAPIGFVMVLGLTLSYFAREKRRFQGSSV
ncbi:MFS transporter [bacterium]|nr:MFS transporter [bacterium]